MKDIRKTIATCETPHTPLQELYCHLKGSIEAALDGHDPQIEVLVGPSRVGKTILLRALERDFPKTTVDGKKHVPVLFVPLDPGVSPKLLPTNAAPSPSRTPACPSPTAIADMTCANKKLLQHPLDCSGSQIWLQRGAVGMTHTDQLSLEPAKGMQASSSRQSVP